MSGVGQDSSEANLFNIQKVMGTDKVKVSRLGEKSPQIIESVRRNNNGEKSKPSSRSKAVVIEKVPELVNLPPKIDTASI